MKFLSAKPSHFLAPFVKFYWMMKTTKPVTKEYIHRIIPNGLIELTFYLGNRPHLVESDSAFPVHSLVSGQLKSFFDIKYADSLTVFSIYLYPHGLSMFFDLPMSELLNQTVSLRHLLKEKSERLEDDLFEAVTFEEKVNVVEHFFLERLKRNYNEYKFARIDHCIDVINQNFGAVDIETLTSEACLSRKQLERTFSDFIGLSPKQFLKVVRFQNVINKKSKEPFVSLTELAYDCGYFDQSHMVKDFRSLSGLSPKDYFNQCTPFSDYFLS
jgi:AraC-like DNA-binding protein